MKAVMKKITQNLKAPLIAVLALLMAALPLAEGIAKGKNSRPLEGVVNVNSASADELMLLPGIGPSKAKAILDFRQTHPFKDPSELTEVKGIGPKMFEKIQGFVKVDGPTTLKTGETSTTASVTQKPVAKAVEGNK